MIVNGEVQAWLQRYRSSSQPPVDVDERLRFNPNLIRSRFGAVVALIDMITMLSVLLTGAALLSGGLTPRESMPGWVQQVMLGAPTTHIVMLSQGILFRGAGPEAVWPQFLALAVIGTVLFGVALARFRKTIGSMG